MWLVAPSLQYLIDLVSRLGDWGYAVVFLAAALESGAFLGLLVPGESLVLVAGFLASRHVLDLDALIVVVSFGAALGDNVSYQLGRWLGRGWLERHRGMFGMASARLERAEAFIARHGGKAVFLGRFVGFSRALVPLLAGASRMPLREFTLYNVLGAACWAATLVPLGYVLGASWQLAERWIGRASAIVGGVLLAGFALAWLWRRAVHLRKTC